MYISFLNIETDQPQKIVIGSKVEYCPHCGDVLSWAYGYEFCRQCQAKVRRAIEKYKAILKEANNVT